MTVAYDKYYKTKNLFGEAYPELIDFFAEYPKDNKVLDLGCGQGRDAIPLARLGFDVTGIDNSIVGIDQLNQIASSENLKLNGIVADIYAYDNFAEYDFVLLNSMFHFAKKDFKKETDFIKRIISKIRKGCLLIFCIQETGEKVEILNETINSVKQLNRIWDKQIKYIFQDSESDHKSETKYRIIAVKK